MRHTAAVAATVLALGALVGACTQTKDPTKAELKEDLVEELRSANPSLDADQAGCFADHIIDEIGVKDVADVKFSASEPDDEMAEQVAAAAIAARDDEACGLDALPR